MTSGRVMLFANTDWYLYNFRLNLACRLKDCGYEVILVSPDGRYRERLLALGFRHIPLNFTARGTNPFQELRLLWRLLVLLRKERPDLLHNFTIKCMLYGSLAAWPGRIPVVNSVTGLGYVFIDSGIRSRLMRFVVRKFYRLVFARKSMTRVVFQNVDDLEYFVDSGMVCRETARLIPGSGVDCRKFQPPAPIDPVLPLRVLFASRMLREKGVFELVAAARILKDRNIPLQVVFAGESSMNDPTSLTPEEIAEIKCEGVVDYLGYVDDMPRLIGSCDLVVLPSYREGLPKILLEAAAMGKPLIASDVPGCRGIVRHEVNGLLVPDRDEQALAAAIETLALDDQLRRTYGHAGRQLVLQQFEESRVLDSTLAVYQELAPVTDDQA